MHLNVRLHDRDLARHQRQCTHLEPRACSMTATDGNCCACADQRPRTQSGFYATYIDGRGWVEQATRWAGYCPNCQLAFNNFATVLRRFSMEKRIRQRTRRWLQSSEQANRVHIAQTHNHNHDSNHKTIPTSSTNRGRANLITSEKACDHWQARDCSMTNNPKYCCSCLDKRPNAPSYAQYVDGIGWVMGAVRWAYYCLGCRNHHELTDRQPHEPRRQTRPRGLQRMKGALRLHGSRLRPETLQIMT
ncbi:hypothetical protein BKA67DRAFT_125419 [Truncatella angustata]|uniref:Uncharacterized protein n=1 Tax=Truncatella angustata TaxID=152316 RepID=A0A9P8UAK6_9PEZI|nr:uncharacterized protein BKA67DRAFT_125419 [Truncatella angustata]KAH6644942.1 hypothetical protein BKA67DRAFT_125419 [Truncatella angustata]